jgi:hypothetical protein
MVIHKDWFPAVREAILAMAQDEAARTRRNNHLCNRQPRQQWVCYPHSAVKHKCFEKRVNPQRRKP